MIEKFISHDSFSISISKPNVFDQSAVLSVEGRFCYFTSTFLDFSISYYCRNYRRYISLNGIKS